MRTGRTGGAAISGALAVSAMAALMALAGCSGTGDDPRPSPTRGTTQELPSASPTATAPPAPTSSPSRSVPPAASAGGLCRQLDYATVATAIGVQFEVAAASGSEGQAQTCVLQRVGSPVPDLTLASTPTTIDAATFRADFQPEGAGTVSNLGKAGYSLISPAATGRGPRVEVGWLTDAGVSTLTFTTAAGTTPAASQAALTKLLGLAKQVAAA